MNDILLYETGNGGDVVIRGNEIVTVEGIENMPYLSMFGGKSWWGNYLIPDSPFLCVTEELLNNTALNSAGRMAIEKAVKQDLAFLDDIDGTTYSVDVSILQPKKVSIYITINGKKFELQWNPDTLFLTYIVL
jgi:hypothetical protein